MQTIGIISDTHGLLRREVFQIFSDCEHILHAGDIGKDEVIAELNTIAPVTAIRGNVDLQAWARKYPETLSVDLAGRTFYLIHNLSELQINPTDENIDVVVSGHSHKPLIEEHNGVLHLNPGSAGPRRFSLPIAVALLHVDENNLQTEIVEISY